MAKKFKVTERTIRYDLEKINLFFTNKGLPISFTIKDGIIITINNLYDKSKTKNSVKGMNLNFSDYIISPDERKYLILMELFFAEDFITINYLANKINVCRNTIVNDLEEVRDCLAENSISPIFIPSKGLHVEGKEKSIRKLGLQVFRKALPLKEYTKLIQNDLSYHSNSDNYPTILFNLLFKNIRIKKIQEYIDILQKSLNIKFYDLEYADLIVCLAMAIQRIRLGYSLSMESQEKLDISNSKVYREVNIILDKMSEYLDIEFDMDEVTYIAQLILASNNSTHLLMEYYPNLLPDQNLTTNLLIEVGKSLKKDFFGDGELYADLSEFILPFIYRQKYQIHVYNPYLREIRQSYPRIFAAINSSVLSLQNDSGKTISDDDLGYITLYFLAALERQNKFNVLILCETGYSIANLLSSKLKSIFNINVVAMAASNQASELLAKYKVDLIVTTSIFSCNNIPCIVVSPLLTEEDILSIRKHIKQNRAKNMDSIC